MAGQDPVEQVRAIWDAYARGGVDAMLEAAGPDVEWLPLEPGVPLGRVSAVVHGFEDARRRACSPTAACARCARAGSSTCSRPGRTSSPSGRLVRAAGYPTREAALAAVAAFTSEA